MATIKETGDIAYHLRCRSICEWLDVALIESGDVPMGTNSIGRGFVCRPRAEGSHVTFNDKQLEILEATRARIPTVRGPIVRNE